MTGTGGSAVRAFNRALAIDQGARVAPAWLYAAGAALLLLRLLHPLERVPAAVWTMILLVSWIPTFAFAFAGYRRRRYDEDYARAWLDLHNHAGGHILAHGLPPNARLQCRPGLTLKMFWKRLPGPAAFVAAVLLVPPASADPETERSSGAGVARRVGAEEELVKTLAERQLLTPAVSAELLDQLQRLDRSARQHPEAAAEALDALRHRRVDEVLRHFDRRLDTLDKTLSLQTVLRERPGDLEAVANAFAAWSASLDNAADDDDGHRSPPPELSQALNQLLANANAASPSELSADPSRRERTDPAALDGLIHAARRNLAEAFATLPRQSLDPATLAGLVRRAGNPSTPDASGDDATGKNGESAQAAAGDASGEGRPGLNETSANAGGNGGVGTDRPSNTPLTFGSETDAQGARFRLEALPTLPNGIVPGVALDRQRAALPDEALPTSGTAREVARGGGSASAQVRAGESAVPLGPSRAAAAERYFERLAAPATP